jgi:hypothetical protein
MITEIQRSSEFATALLTLLELQATLKNSGKLYLNQDASVVILLNT